MTADSADTANRFRALTAVRDGDGYVIGSPRSADYLAVPEIGGRVVEWLRAGHDVDRCTDLAEAAAGQPVDVARFVAVLDAAGLLPDPAESPDSESDSEAAVPSDTPHPLARGIGRILFGPVGLATQGVLGLAAVVLLTVRPTLRPTFEDGFIVPAPLAAMLVLAAIGTATGLLHEVAHVVAAARYGVRSRLSIGRRLFAIVYQTDLTGLWALPRGQRAVPIAAGMASDAGILGLLLITELVLPTDAPPLVVAVVRALVLLKVTALLFQFEVFMRTDVYALFALATRSRNLWAVKGAVARAALGRTGPGDQHLLSATDPREVRWAKVYLALYLPGVAWATWYFVAFGIPSLHRIAQLSIDAIGADGLLSLAGLSGALAIALTFGPLSWTVWGVVRSAGRTATLLVRPAQG